MQKITYILIVILFIAILVAAFVFINKPLLTDITNTTETASEITSEVISEDSNIVEIPYLSDSEYEEKVLNYKGKVLIDFYTDWCYYCTVLSPLIEEVAPDFDNIRFYKTNAEVDTNISERNRITAYPTIVLFENGVEINRSLGAMPKEELIRFLNGENIVE